ncbi:MAG: flotillin-like FloA family protein [Candidatus Riflebacteria bacterium]|jgi:uncharacterized protein YqfA (UPF0365 family)|nr:flotillin-like FloA family protein [Candidatus Riflebacteria bacterium]
MNAISLILLMIVPEILLLLFLIWYLRLSLIIKGLQAGLAVTPMMLIGMRMRKVDPALVILNAIKVIKAGVGTQLSKPEDLVYIFEAHCLAGGNVGRVAAALIEGQNRGENLTVKQACAIDLELTAKETN